MLLFSRFTPNVLLSAAVALSVILAAVMLGLAIDQRWLGLKLEAQPRLAVPVSFEGLWIDAIEHDSPAAGQPGAGIPASVASLVSLGGPDGRRIQLTPQDLMEEPDALETYAGMRAFFARQAETAAVLRSIGGAPLGIAFLGETQTHSVSPKRQRPVGASRPRVRMERGGGRAGVGSGAWIWSLRRGDWATRFLLLAGAGLLRSALPAAAYSPLQRALPGGWFRVLY